MADKNNIFEQIAQAKRAEFSVDNSGAFAVSKMEISSMNIQNGPSQEDIQALYKTLMSKEGKSNK